jgi:hypothetical protein
MGGGASAPAVGHPTISNLRTELALECEKPVDLSDLPAADESNLREEVTRLRKWLRHAREDIGNAFKEPAVGGAAPAEDTVIKSEDGTVVHMSKTGHRKQVDPDGTVIEVWPDGRKLQTLVQAVFVRMYWRAICGHMFSRSACTLACACT